VTRETYRGVKLYVRALKGAHWGYCEIKVNGVNWGRNLGVDEAAHLPSLRSGVDMAIAEPDRMAPFWQPGYASVKAHRLRNGATVLVDGRRWERVSGRHLHDRLGIVRFDVESGGERVFYRLDQDVEVLRAVAS